MTQAKIGVIGGTGLYDIEGMTNLKEINIDTPFGDPSDAITVGKLDGVGVAFLPRHGRGHRIMPSDIPTRANIYALKSLGVERIISINSCGSFKTELAPGHLLVPDQLIDRTKSRCTTFFGDGVVVHISMAQPFCPDLSKVLFNCARQAGAEVHSGGTYVAMEGPAFSSAAESRLYKGWGADVIGMTIVPEASLAREAEICYASLCAITDYDAWMERQAGVTIDIVLDHMKKNIALARRIISLAVREIADKRTCLCATALETAIVTAPAVMSLAQRRRFDLLIGKYIH